jgi:hypothetical protein
MTSDSKSSTVHPPRLPSSVERHVDGPLITDTFAGRVHVEWDSGGALTPLDQLPFFIEFVKQGGLFDGWVEDCPLYFTSPNAPHSSGGTFAESCRSH